MDRRSYIMPVSPHTVEQHNYAGNIIASLAGLPEFLRKPILKKRLAEFWDLSEDEQTETICNALEAGPRLPFDIFARLFETWLVALAEMSEAERRRMLWQYAVQLAASPQHMAALHTDGLLAVFYSVDATTQETLAKCIRGIMDDMKPADRRMLIVMMPDSAKAALGL